MLLMFERPGAGLTASHDIPTGPSSRPASAAEAGPAAGQDRRGEFDAARPRTPAPPKVDVDPASIKVGVKLAPDLQLFAELCDRGACPSRPGRVERALPSIGAHLAHDQENKRVDIDLDGERMGLNIADAYTRSEAVKVDPKYSWRKERLYSYHFTGELRLTISGDFNGRNAWADGKRARLEQKIEDVLAGLVTGAKAIVQLRTEREEQRKRWEEQAHQAEIARERQRRLRHFGEQLLKEAEA